MTCSTLDCMGDDGHEGRCCNADGELLYSRGANPGDYYYLQDSLRDITGIQDVVSGVGAGKGVNPKDQMGMMKLPMFSVIPPASMIYEARAMQYGAHLAPKADGTLGYGRYNWRENKVVMSIYLDAIVRHLLGLYDGEDNADDSGVPHLGHIKACCGILADAKENGNLVDDRPTPGPAARLLHDAKTRRD